MRRRYPLALFAFCAAILLLVGGVLFVRAASAHFPSSTAGDSPALRDQALAPPLPSGGPASGAAQPDVTTCNTGSITIPASSTTGPASPYPSNITISGQTGVVTKVVVTLTNINHTN